MKTDVLKKSLFPQIFKIVTNKEMEKIRLQTSKTTKRNTAWGLKIFQGRCVCCNLAFV